MSRREDWAGSTERIEDRVPGDGTALKQLRVKGDWLLRAMPHILVRAGADDVRRNYVHLLTAAESVENKLVRSTRTMLRKRNTAATKLVVDEGGSEGAPTVPCSSGVNLVTQPGEVFNVTAYIEVRLCLRHPAE